MGFLKDFTNYLGSSNHLKKIWTKKYHKLYGKSISKGYNSSDAHVDSLARILVAQSKLSNYHVNRSKLIAELFPFGIKKNDERIALFFEYISFLQDNADVKFDLLRNGVNYIINESLEGTNANNYSEIIYEAIQYDIAWSRLLTYENRDKINDLRKKFRQEDSNNTIDGEVNLKLTVDIIKNIESEVNHEIQPNLKQNLRYLKSRVGIFRHSSSELKEQIITEFIKFTEDDDAIRQISKEIYYEIVSMRQRGKIDI